MRKLSVFAVVAMLALSACTQLGLVAPEDFPERLAYSYTALEQTRNSAASLLQARKLSVEDAKKILALTDMARMGLDSSRDLYFEGKDLAAQRALDRATQAITSAKEVGRE